MVWHECAVCGRRYRYQGAYWRHLRENGHYPNVIPPLAGGGDGGQPGQDDPADGGNEGEAAEAHGGDLIIPDGDDWHDHLEHAAVVNVDGGDDRFWLANDELEDPNGPEMNGAADPIRRLDDHHQAINVHFRGATGSLALALYEENISRRATERILRAVADGPIHLPRTMEKLNRMIDDYDVPANRMEQRMETVPLDLPFEGDYVVRVYNCGNCSGLTLCLPYFPLLLINYSSYNGALLFLF